MLSRMTANTTCFRPTVVCAALLLACSGLACPAAGQEKPKGNEPGRPVKGFQRPGVTPAVPAPGMQPGVQPGVQPVAPSQPAQPTHPAQPLENAGDDMVTLSAFTEPVTLASLVDMVAETLQINVATKGDVPGTVVFNAPVPVKKSELVALLDQLLEQQGWTITKDKFGFYTVAPTLDVRPMVGSDRPTTRVFSTPNIQPSSIKSAIEGQFVGNPQVGARQYTYIDELGVIVATDTPRKLDAIQAIIDQITEHFKRAQFIRLELTYIAAPVARERALQLIGQMSQPTRSDPNQAIQNQIQNFNPQGGAGQVGALSNLGGRLTVDPQGNALFFRGLPDEIEDVRKLLTIIDRPNALVPKQYFAGSAAKQIADLARGQGLGEVTTIARGQNTQFAFQQNELINNAQRGSSTVGGPVMVVDESSGNIIYYATPQQQERLAALIKELDTKAERIVLETYKLRNSDAEDVADILNNLITNSQPLGSSSILPGGGQPQATPRRNVRPQAVNGAGATGSAFEDSFGFDADSFVIADVSNNQVIVKARAGQQTEFAKLIGKLDQRKPQVYVEAMIVAVTTDDRLRLAFENQLINAHGTGGVLNTNFGLGSFGTTAAQPILGVKGVSTALSGMTAAIIKSDQVPLVMTALANQTDSKIVSSPQLLVDDNEEAQVVSIDEQPTTTISRGTGGSGDVVAQGESATAGTTLKVTPRISDSAALRLKYEIELSSFTGEAQTVGGTVLSPPKQTNKMNSESITVPTDSTVVVGGLVVSQDNKTVAKVPLLGDIPLIGKLFSDTKTGDRKTRLYVFLTPRIIRDPNFEDLRLLSQGPQSASSIAREFPVLAPRSIDIWKDTLPAGPAQGSTPEGADPSLLNVLPDASPATPADLPPVEETKPAVPTPRPIPPVRDSDKQEMNPD
ncbi:MAG: secretin N-terminal domain-containing protein [Phycisphaerales bacterium]